MAVHTAYSLRATCRRLARRLQQAELVLSEMRGGAALHLQFAAHGPAWTLTNGTRVADGVARLVIKSGSVEAVGDALFAGELSQTWRWWSVEDQGEPGAA
jgi:hypothetical protein